jgi:secreted trypsin-like serine protease
MMKYWMISGLLISAGTFAQVGQGPLPPPVNEETQTEEEDEDGRIVGGDPAEPGTAPWQIQIYSTVKYTPDDLKADNKLPDGHADKIYIADRDEHELSHRCGGSYIGDGWILTAAHCLNVPKGSNFLTDRRIKMGTQNLNVGGATFAIETAVKHVGYSKGRNDVALIKVRDDGQLAKLVAAGRLAKVQMHAAGDPKLYANEELRVTGWGFTGKRGRDSLNRMDVGGRVQNNPVRLRQVAINYRPDSVCQNAPDYKKIWTPKSLCAGSGDPGKDSCVGDSGGPLTRLQKGERVLVGVVAFGIGCAYKGIPGVYMRVSAYQDWIAKAKLAGKGLSQR